MILVLGTSLAASAAMARRSLPSVHGRAPRVESFVLEKLDTLNERIVAAGRAGQPWTKDPVRVALELSGESPLFARTLDVRFEGNRSEASDSAVVTLVAEGYADDSVLGCWLRLRLARKRD